MKHKLEKLVIGAGRHCQLPGGAKTVIGPVLRGTSLLLIGLAWLGASGAASAQDAGEYRLRPGDQIAITLPLNPELNAAGPIGPDGRFGMPLAGRLVIGGLTPGEAETLIAGTLRGQGIVADARPSVAITLFGAAVYVGGEVRNPGEIALIKAPNAMQAVILAGGLLDTARTRKVAIITPVASGPARVRTVDLVAYRHHGAGGVADRSLSPGDIVFVPKSTIAEVDLWIDQHINRIIPNSAHFNYNAGGNVTSTTSVIP